MRTACQSIAAKVKGCQFAELLRRYDDCLRIAKWADRNLFLNSSLVKMLLCVFTQAVDQPIRDVAETLWNELSISRMGIREERIDYSQLRVTKTVIISDVAAGFAITQYDWCGMASFLGSYAKYTDVIELNPERSMDFSKVATGLTSVLLGPSLDVTYHGFCSPPDCGGGQRSNLDEWITGLSGIVRSVTQQGCVPYLCLDMIAIRELESSHPNFSSEELVIALQKKGAIVGQSDTFWVERSQLLVEWDAQQGSVVQSTRESLNATTSSEETVMKY
jgi:hypothetical protein